MPCTADADARCVRALQVRGPGVFAEYFRRPEATAESFSPGGWFTTGDHASRDADGLYRILGRASVDVLKSAGYKISALEVRTPEPSVACARPRARERVRARAPRPDRQRAVPAPPLAKGAVRRRACR